MLFLFFSIILIDNVKSDQDIFDLFYSENYLQDIDGNNNLLSELFPGLDVGLTLNISNETVYINNTNETQNLSKSLMDSNSANGIDEAITFKLDLQSEINLFRGDSQVTYEIINLPGKNDLNVNLNMFYSSEIYNFTEAGIEGGQPSWVGMGWSLAYGSIIKDFGDEQWETSDDKLYISALGYGTEELIPIGNGHYTTRFNRNFKIFYDSNNQQWIVTDLDGKKYYFANTRVNTVLNAANCNAAGGGIIGYCDYSCGHTFAVSAVTCREPSVRVSPYAWDLTKIEDVYGNEINIYYENDLTTKTLHYPSTIATNTPVMYNGYNCNQCAPEFFTCSYSNLNVGYTKESYMDYIIDTIGRKIVFELGTEDRIDIPQPSNNNLGGVCPGFNEPQFYRLNKYLNKIKVYDENQNLVAIYDLNYKYLQDGDINKLVLDSIQRLNPENIAEGLPKTYFSYYDLDSEEGRGRIYEMDNYLGGRILYDYEPKNYEFINGVSTNEESRGLRVKDEIKFDNNENIFYSTYDYKNGNLDTSNPLNNVIGYQKVTRANPGNGYEENYFYNDLDNSDCLWCPDDSITNFNELDGKLYLKKVFAEDNKLIIKHEIDWEAYKSSAINSFQRRKTYEVEYYRNLKKSLTLEYDGLINGKPRMITEEGSGLVKTTYRTYAYELYPELESLNLINKVAIEMMGDSNSDFISTGVGSQNIEYLKMHEWVLDNDKPYPKKEYIWDDIDEDMMVDSDEMILIKDSNYDSYGNILSFTNSRGLINTWAYDTNYLFKTSESNNLIGNLMHKTHNTLGKTLTSTDANGYITQSIWDPYYRLEKLIRPGDSFSSPSYEIEYNNYDYGPNLIDDTSFEDSGSSWNNYPLESHVTQDCNSGDGCAKAIKGNWNLKQPLLGKFQPDTQYVLSYWSKIGDRLPDLNSTRVVIGSDDDVGWTGEKYVSCGFSVTEEWRYHECIFTTPPDVDNNPVIHLMIGSDGLDEGLYNYVDDVVIKKKYPNPNIILTSKIDDGINMVKRTYFDGFSNKIRNEIENDNQDIIVDFEYNDRGLKTLESLPTGETLRTEYENNPIGNVKRIYLPGLNTYSEIIYGGSTGQLTTNSIDELNRFTREYSNIFGDTTKVEKG